VGNVNSQLLQDSLAEINKKIDQASNNIEINRLIEGFITSLVDSEFASLWFYNKSDMTLVRERDGSTPRVLSLDVKKGILYKCFMTKEAAIYNYLASDKDYVASVDNPDGIKIKSKVMVPLIYQDEFVGIVTGYSSTKKPKKFTKEDVKILQACSSYFIDVLYKMHPCGDVNCLCNTLKHEEAEEVTVKEIKKIEESNQKEQVQDDITNSIANFVHDIRTPANTLYGFLELLENQIADKRIKEYVINAKESASFINQLTTEMLDRVSLQKEQESSQIKEVEATNYFANIVEMFSSNMYEKNIDFSIYIDPFLPKVIKVDELKLKRVIMNLIGNAYKFTPRDRSIEFSVKYYQEQQKMFIQIKDTGIGIAKDQQKEIFKAFKQAEETTSLRYGGTGLGLAICAGYVAEFGGALELESEIDKGSRFYFTIPVEVVDSTPTFESIEDKQIKVAILTSANNTVSVSNIGRYLVNFGVKKENIIAVTSSSMIPKNVKHLIVYQHKFDTNVQKYFGDNAKILIVEEELFSTNYEELDENCDVVSKYGYCAENLYKFLSSKRVPKVLLVDDDKTSIILLTKMLESEHCDIEVADNGKIALEMIIDAYKKGSPYKIVYIDNRMPLMNGVDVIRHVRDFEKDNNLEPIYVVSTSGDVLDPHTEGKLFDECIGKPFRSEDVKKVLNR